MEAAAAVTLLAVVLVIAALVVYLVAVILELRKITAGLDAVIGSVGGVVEKSEPVNTIVEEINRDLAAGTELLEGLLVKKAGPDDAAGLVESVFPGAGAAMLERQGRTGEVENIDAVYTRGAVQLARLGRASPLGAGPETGAALRNAAYASAAAQAMYHDPAATRRAREGRSMPRSPKIGVGAPEVYPPDVEASEATSPSQPPTAQEGSDADAGTD
jgi:hypothetical protein